MMYKSTLFTAAVGAVAAATAMAQNTFTANTPTSLLTCRPALLSWVGGTAPYYPAITTGGNTADQLVAFTQTSSTSLTWTVNISAGTAVTFDVIDSTGASAPSAQVTIGTGSTDCLAGGSSASSSAAGSSSAGSSSAAGTSSSSASSSRSSSSAATSSATSSRTSSSAAGTSSAASAASSAVTSAASSGAEAYSGIYAAIAGLLGVGVAALA